MMFTDLVNLHFGKVQQASTQQRTDLQNELPSASLGCQGFKLLFETLWLGVRSSSL